MRHHVPARLAALLGIALTLASAAATGASATPSRSAKLTPGELAWSKPVIGAYNLMAANLGVFVDEEKAPNALLPGSGKNNTLLTRSIIAFVSCRDTVRKAGPAPTARLAAFATAMTNACAHLSAGANDIAKAAGAYKKGIGKLVTSNLVAGNAELKQGSNLLAAAAKRLIALGGKNVFEA